MTGKHDGSKLKLFRADLHIHTCLSPCGDWDMTPRAVVEKGVEKKLDIIAISDHNCVDNAETAIKIGRMNGVAVFPAMELCSEEEVHIIALFDTIEDALSMQGFVYENLSGDNNPDVFGYQVVADENDCVVHQNPKLLMGSLDVGLKDLVDHIHLHKGLAIAAHIDKTAFSILGQLGFIPPDLKLDGVEVSYRNRPEEAELNLLGGMNIPCITSSDAHFLDEIGRVSTKFLISEPSVREIKLALDGCQGRKIVYSQKKLS